MTRTSTTLRFALLLTVANSFLDAHTYIARGHVFANVQTGNVIFFAIDASERHGTAALAHVWPIVAFVAGVALSAYLKSGRVERHLKHPLRWTMLVQVIVLAVIGFVPASVPNIYITVPISFVAGIQIGLFRSIGDLTYIPLATTGNIMRFVEFGYAGLVDRDAEARAACRTYALLIVFFAAGAVVGAYATRGLGIQAIWLPAGLLAVTLILFVVDERREIGLRRDGGPARR
ncbi:YoaK family protein [Mycobacterium sp. DL592]|uniref:YoaK family protein n=1 Tax=Mycobacterium sp. DL592 TaxID=2675524 RepID=UPI00141D80A5|nr:YoaK family protein [Mycobacterium sp. DL592]